jgi:hypothetical protein
VIGPPDYEWIPEDTDRLLVRGFGLLEEHCSRASPQAPWRGDFFMGQMRWMKKPLKWKVLGPELRGLGYEIVRHARPELGADYYEVVESGSTASIFRGHVYKISATDRPPYPSGTRDFNAIHRTVYAAIGRPRSTWPDWLAGEDGPDPDRLRTAERTVYTVLSEHPSRAAAGVAFHAYLMDQAAAAKAWPADEWAYRFAQFAAEHRDLPGVPAPDTVAAHCLAALPMDRAAAARLPTDWRAVAPPDVRASKMTRALLRRAREAAPQEPATTAELTEWEPALKLLC